MGHNGSRMNGVTGACATPQESRLNDTSPFFEPVGSVARHEVITCDAQATVHQVASIMHERSISSIIVRRDGTEVGIITDRDLRAMLADGRDAQATRACDIMRGPLFTINEDRPLYEALYHMSRRRTHRMCVTDASGKLIGMVTGTDLQRLQTRNALGLVLAIERAESVEELRSLHDQVQKTAVDLFRQGLYIGELVGTVARLNDLLLVRLIKLVRQDYPTLTKDCAFLVLGSEGRGEQTLATDQDNALVYADHLSAAEVDELARFSEALITALIGIGVPECTGGIMARNPEWRRSLSDWKHTVHKWYTTPIPDHVVHGTMFFDMRRLYGDPALAQQVQQAVIDAVSHSAPFLARSAANIVRFCKPFGWFGRIETELKDGVRSFDVKKNGLFPITEGVKVLIQQKGLVGGNTHQRIEMLEGAQVLTPKQARNLVASFDVLLHLRLKAQFDALAAGKKPHNFLSFEGLDRLQIGQLKLALQTVETFGRFLEQHFQLGGMR